MSESEVATTEDKVSLPSILEKDAYLDALLTLYSYLAHFGLVAKLPLLVNEILDCVGADNSDGRNYQVRDIYYIIQQISLCMCFILASNLRTLLHASHIISERYIQCQ